MAYGADIGGINNAGLIDGGEGNTGGWGILASVTTIQGNLVNSGTIVSQHGFGINLQYAEIQGDLINTGTISAPEQVAILLEESSVTGKIINSGTISGSKAIVINNVAAGTVTIDNSGTLDGQVELSKDILNLNGNKRPCDRRSHRQRGDRQCQWQLHRAKRLQCRHLQCRPGCCLQRRQHRDRSQRAEQQRHVGGQGCHAIYRYRQL